ncbi:MAG: OsmC family protein [Solirubrobacteraceae bacterium]|jgi:putative redox protein
MVEAEALATPYQTAFRAGAVEGRADTLEAGRGGRGGMRPHELLEAALATCMAITARMALEELGIEAPGLRVRVELERSERETAYVYELRGDRGLTAAQRAAVYDRLERCPVRRTLSRPARFEQRAVA